MRPRDGQGWVLVPYDVGQAKEVTESSDIIVIYCVNRQDQMEEIQYPAWWLSTLFDLRGIKPYQRTPTFGNVSANQPKQTTRLTAIL